MNLTNSNEFSSSSGAAWVHTQLVLSFQRMNCCLVLSLELVFFEVESSVKSLKHEMADSLNIFCCYFSIMMLK
jgi:hypothetical protein